MKKPGAPPGKEACRADSRCEGAALEEGAAPSAPAHSSRDIRRRSLPDFLDTTVATVVKPAVR